MKLKKITKGIIYASALSAGVMYFSEAAYAFNIDAFVGAATGPLLKGVEDHWGKAVVLSAVGAALFGEGDGRQRALRAGIAAGSSGGVILGLLKLFT